MQKTLLFLGIHSKNGKETHFQDLVRYLDRDKSQISVLLRSLEERNLIERSATRPQKISLTLEGIKNMADHTISPFEHYLSQLNNHKNTKILSEAQKKVNETLKKSEIIEFILSKVKPQIEQDLKTIDDYITADQFLELSESLLERFESIISFVFSRIEVYIKEK